jgi:hypothetical protein
MVFSTLDEGPFWMSHEEREKKRHNEIIQGQTVKRKLTKKELQELLLTKGITDRRGNKRVYCRYYGRGGGSTTKIIRLTNTTH